MAAKVPPAAGSTTLAGPWDCSSPYFTGANVFNDGIKAGALRGPDRVIFFGPASTATDLDNGDTYRILPAGSGTKVVLYAWAPGSATNTTILYDGDGNFTASGASQNAGWLLVWLGAL